MKEPLCSYLCTELRGFLGRHLIHIAVIELWPRAPRCHSRPQVILTPQEKASLCTCSEEAAAQANEKVQCIKGEKGRVVRLHGVLE